MLSRAFVVAMLTVVLVLMLATSARLVMHVLRGSAGQAVLMAGCLVLQGLIGGFQLLLLRR